MEFSERRDEFKKLGAVILGLSPDNLAAHRKFVEKHGLSVNLLSDPDHRVLETYGAWGTKKMYGKEFEGVIRSTVLIDPEGRVRQSWPKAKSKGHAAEVLDALRGMAA